MVHGRTFLCTAARAGLCLHTCLYACLYACTQVLEPVGVVFLVIYFFEFLLKVRGRACLRACLRLSARPLASCERPPACLARAPRPPAVSSVIRVGERLVRKAYA